jgi:hypothetical protein
MLPASAENEPRDQRALRRWGPIGALVAAAVVVVAIIVVGGGDDDSAEAPQVTDAVSDVTAPTGVDADETLSDEDVADTASPTDGTTDPDTEADTDAEGSEPDVEVPAVLSFSRAAELGLDVEWGERCDTSTGRVAVPDFFAPECYAPYSGDNGGATDVGVTNDTIRIVYYRGPDNDPIIRYITDAIANDDDNDDALATLLGMNSYFETYYETYGRSVEVIPYVSTGIASDEVTARADAVRIAEDLAPFMVWGGPALTSAFADELSARGVLCLSCSPSQPVEWYAERFPLVWAIDASAAQKMTHAAEFAVKQLAGGNAEHAGSEAFRTTPRSFGFVYIESSATSVQQAARFTADLSSGGIELAETVAYTLDPSTIQQSASQAVARLKAAGVTTVLYSGDPIAPRDFTREATAQDYFPEWVLVAPALNDTNAFARTYDQQQWAAAFGVTTLSVRLDPTNSGYYRLFTWFHGEEPPAADTIGVIAPTPAVFYSALQEVGPQLTRTAWAMALADGQGTTPAITQPSLAWGDTGHWDYVDHHGIDDATLIFWDPDATGPDEIRREGTGMWRFADAGRRYLPGTWPDTSGLFDTGSSVTLFEQPPPEEAPPSYPSPAG